MVAASLWTHFVSLMRDVFWQAKHLVEMGRAGDLFYHTLLDSCPDEELLAVLDIALQCVNSVSTLRPSMLKVVKMLERIRGGGDNLGGGGGSLSSHLSLYNIPSSQLTTPTSPCSHPSSQISLCWIASFHQFGIGSSWVKIATFTTNPPPSEVKYIAWKKSYMTQARELH